MSYGCLATGKIFLQSQNASIVRPLYEAKSRHEVLDFFSSRPNWDPPPPHPQASAPLPFWFRGGTHSLAREGVEGGPNSDVETDSVVL